MNDGNQLVCFKYEEIDTPCKFSEIERDIDEYIKALSILFDERKTFNDK